MTELEELIKQKREIESKIKMLRNQTTVWGMAKVDVERYSTRKPDRHFLAIRYKPLDNGREKWQTIFSANNRQEVINAIPQIIENLKNLYKNVTEPEEEENESV